MMINIMIAIIIVIVIAFLLMSLMKVFESSSKTYY